MEKVGLRSMKPLSISNKLVKNIEGLRFGPPVTHVYNPLVYAAKPHRAYLRKYAAHPREILLVGMNPGPWGMAQTGVPFGDVARVRSWLQIDLPVARPANEHPKRPVQGFQCPRSEVSGTRLWGWAQERFGTPEKFFARFFVWNFCPLSFMEESGRNRTPDKLPANESKPLFEACEVALSALVGYLNPRYVLGIGAFAEKQIAKCLHQKDIITGRIPHPSPANPAANKGWAKAAEAALARYGIQI